MSSLRSEISASASRQKVQPKCLKKISITGLLSEASLSDTPLLVIMLDITSGSINANSICVLLFDGFKTIPVRESS